MYTVASNSQTGNCRFFLSEFIELLVYENQVQRNITVRLSDAHITLHNITYNITYNSTYNSTYNIT